MLDRRGFLKGVGAAAAIVAFDPITRRWLPAGEAAEPADPIPPLDGELVMDGASLEAASSDAGNIISRRPWAVLRPGSVNDVATMIGFCRPRGLAVAARGQAHSVYGQPLVDGGLIIEMATLSALRSITATSADVEAGMLWSELLDHALAIGATPIVFTGFIALSIGGTLSVGGISTRPYVGAQVDHVLALEVVTGAGDIVECSAAQNADLFNAVLAGMGQFGVITRAVIALEPAPAMVKHWMLNYTDPHAFFADLRMVIERNELPHVWGQFAPPGSPTTSDPSTVRTLANLGLFEILKPLLGPVLRLLLTPAGPALGAVSSLAPDGQWVYQLNLALHHDGGAIDEDHLLRGLSDIKPLRQSSDRSFRDFTLRIDALVDALKALGMWEGVPHPWIDNFLPGDRVEDFVVETFQQMNFEDMGAAGLGLLFPMRRSHLTRPSLVMPTSDPDWVMLFDILTSAPAPGPNTAFVERMLARNREIYERARSIGGTVYPISAVPTSHEDWAAHYGPRYPSLVALKAQYDPDAIMTPGMPMF